MLEQPVYMIYYKAMSSYYCYRYASCCWSIVHDISSILQFITCCITSYQTEDQTDHNDVLEICFAIISSGTFCCKNMLRIFFYILLAEIILLLKYVKQSRSQSCLPLWLPDDLRPELLCVTVMLSFSLVQNTEGGGSPLASHSNLQSDLIEASSSHQQGNSQGRKRFLVFEGRKEGIIIRRGHFRREKN